VRLALLVLLLLVATAVRAQDDDDSLDQPSLGPGIPEKMQELEKEWAEDVGKDPTDEPKAEPDDDAAEPADAYHDDEPEHAAPSRPIEQLVPKAPPPSALSRPSGEADVGKRPGKAKPAPADAKAPAKPAAPAPSHDDANARGED
jgi:hypothetical protein